MNVLIYVWLSLMFYGFTANVFSVHKCTVIYTWFAYFYKISHLWNPGKHRPQNPPSWFPLSPVWRVSMWPHMNRQEHCFQNLRDLLAKSSPVHTSSPTPGSSCEHLWRRMVGSRHTGLWLPFLWQTGREMSHNVSHSWFLTTRSPERSAWPPTQATQQRIELWPVSI
jgi:hypothetical protein